MLFFRVICGAAMAWVVSWILRGPEAAYLQAETPEMLYIGPPCAAFVGFFILAGRQGLGLVNGILNGFWTGIVAVILAGFVYLVYRCSDPVLHGLVEDFRAFLRIAYYEAKPLIESMKNMRLIGLTIGLTTLIGAGTELLQWGMVRFKKKKEEDEPYMGR